MVFSVLGSFTVRSVDQFSLTEFSEAVMMCLKLLLYLTHITGSLWVVIISFDELLKKKTRKEVRRK